MKKKLFGLETNEYEHAWDRAALRKLESIPGLPSLTKKLFELSYEKISRIQNVGSYLKITRTNIPKVHSLLAEACSILDIHKVPEIYVKWDHSVGGYTSGVKDPFIVLHSGAIDLLEDNELLFVLGHELGHIKSKHVLYYQIASLFPSLVEQLSQATLGLGGIAGTGIELALMNWARMSEFTCDRAGLLACQDVEPCIKAMVKLAGLPATYNVLDFKESFLEQAKEFEELDFDTLNQAFKVLSTLNRSHPWIVMRGAQFVKWIDSGEYKNILENDNRGFKSVIKLDKFCPNCGENIQKNDKFCAGCGASIVN